MKTETSKPSKQTSEYVIAVNGGYWDGIYGGRSLLDAKRMTLKTARGVNKLIMAGQANVIRATN